MCDVELSRAGRCVLGATRVRRALRELRLWAATVARALNAAGGGGLGVGHDGAGFGPRGIRSHGGQRWAACVLLTLLLDFVEALQGHTEAASQGATLVPADPHAGVPNLRCDKGEGGGGRGKGQP